jgi:hypothetical protein
MLKQLFEGMLLGMEGTPPDPVASVQVRKLVAVLVQPCAISVSARDTTREQLACNVSLRGWLRSLAFWFQRACAQLVLPSSNPTPAMHYDVHNHRNPRTLTPPDRNQRNVRFRRAGTSRRVASKYCARAVCGSSAHFFAQARASGKSGRCIEPCKSVHEYVPD